MIFKYISGNNINKAINISNKIIKKNKIPIINYAVESSINNNIIINEFNNINSKINSNCKIAIKLSLFNFDKKIICDVLDNLIKKDIQILVDAENDENYNNYNNLTNDLILNYNKNQINIIKTYQMYRKDSLINIDNDINIMKNNNIKLGVKLVRGAYWNSDKNSNNLFLNKLDTDLNYNEGILQLYNKNKNSLNILATHNNESINLGYLLNKNKNRKIFEFGHLMGMKEKKFNYLVENGQNVNVYIPYGPYKYMIPYLSRRLYENIDTVKYMIT
tara:strand:- start:619 stop:1443 length:825 start_codon:yes stop_codon:yes gene_type:complete